MQILPTDSSTSAHVWAKLIASLKMWVILYYRQWLYYSLETRTGLGWAGLGWVAPPENKYLSRIKTLYLQIISHISYSLTVTLWLWHRGGLVCWDDHTLNIKSQYPNVVWLLWLARGGRWLRCNNGHIVAARYHLSTVAATGRVREWGLWWRHVTWSPSRHTRPHTGHRDSVSGQVSP